MTKQPVCCTPEMSLEVVARMMVQHDCGAIPVVGDLATRLPLGLITDRDIVTRTVAHGRNPIDLAARDCMTSPAVTIDESTRLQDCVESLELGQIRRMLVVDGSGSCIGIVAQADIAAHASKRQTGDLVREVSKPTVQAFVSSPA